MSCIVFCANSGHSRRGCLQRKRGPSPTLLEFVWYSVEVYAVCHRGNFCEEINGGKQPLPVKIGKTVTRKGGWGEVPSLKPPSRHPRPWAVEENTDTQSSCLQKRYAVGFQAFINVPSVHCTSSERTSQSVQFANVGKLSSFLCCCDSVCPIVIPPVVCPYDPQRQHRID